MRATDQQTAGPATQEIDMTTAHEIMYSARNADAADKRAQELTDTIEQDWGNEATLYTFADESVLLVTGGQVNAYASMAEARAALED
jgi:hypothetical protein